MKWILNPEVSWFFSKSIVLKKVNLSITYAVEASILNFLSTAFSKYFFF